MTERPWLSVFIRYISQQPQRQDSLEDQLRDLHRVAARTGCYDAADWIWKLGIARTRTVADTATLTDRRKP